eukprot:3059286-Pyramimonas_sp.AAC.1
MSARALARKSGDTAFCISSPLGRPPASTSERDPGVVASCTSPPFAGAPVRLRLLGAMSVTVQQAATYPTEESASGAVSSQGVLRRRRRRRRRLEPRPTACPADFSRLGS